jgi:tetratricopeptide (TPR) repeat protein
MVTNDPIRWRLVPLVLLLTVLFFLFACAGGQKIRNQKQSEALRRVGEAYLAEGKYTLALRELLQAEKLNAEDHLLQGDLGMAYMAKGHLDEAIAHFSEALRINPDYAPAKNNLGTAYLAKGDYDAAIPIFEALTQDILYSTPHYPLYNLGWAYFQKKNYIKAEQYFREALDLRPEFVMARRWLGRTYLERGMVQNAIKELEKAVARAPREGPVHYDLGRAYLMAGRRDLALQHFEAAVEVSPPDSKIAEQARLAVEDLRSR